MFAWDSIYKKSLDEGTLEYMRELFPDVGDIYLEERDFSRLHKAVLGINFLSIGQVLADASAIIDKPDSNRASPLIWAIYRKDIISVKLLLKAGADVNVRTKQGCTALHFAAFNSDLLSIKLLLQYRSVVSHQESSLINALIFAAHSCQKSEVFQVLLAVGTDIKARDMFDNTALVRSAAMNNTFRITTLLDFGAQIDVIDADGNTPLPNAIRFGQNNTVQTLLERGADYTLINLDGDIFLHRAAQSGDLLTINILRNANLKIIDPYTHNKKGQTPFKLAQTRMSKLNGFINLFLVLLFEIRNRNDYLAGCARLNNRAGTQASVTGDVNNDRSSRRSSDTEEFFDARE